MKLYYSHEIWHRVQLWQEAVQPKEIGWIGNVKESNKNLIVTDVYLFPKQDCSAATFKVGAAEVGEFYETLAGTGVDPGSLNLLGHGHVNMKTFKSSTDKEHDADFLKGHDWGVSVVHNLSGETFAELYIEKPFSLCIQISVEVLPAYYADDELQKKAAMDAMYTPPVVILAPAQRMTRYTPKDYRSTGYEHYHDMYSDMYDYSDYGKLRFGDNSLEISDLQKAASETVFENPYPRRLRRRLKRLAKMGDDEVFIGEKNYKIKGDIIFEYKRDGSFTVVDSVDNAVEIANMIEFTGRQVDV